MSNWTTEKIKQEVSLIRERYKIKFKEFHPLMKPDVMVDELLVVDSTFFIFEHLDQEDEKIILWRGSLQGDTITWEKEIEIQWGSIVLGRKFKIVAHYCCATEKIIFPQWCTEKKSFQIYVYDPVLRQSNKLICDDFLFVSGITSINKNIFLLDFLRHKAVQYNYKGDLISYCNQESGIVFPFQIERKSDNSVIIINNKKAIHSWPDFYPKKLPHLAGVKNWFYEQSQITDIDLNELFFFNKPMSRIIKRDKYYFCFAGNYFFKLENTLTEVYRCFLYGEITKNFAELKDMSNKKGIKSFVISSEGKYIWAINNSTGPLKFLFKVEV